MITLDTVKQYQKQFSIPDEAEGMIKTFWRVSAFPDDLLFSKLMEIADTEFEDDYYEFLKKQNLLKAGLALVGFKSLSPIETSLAQTSDPLERIAAVAALLPKCSEEYFVRLREEFSENYERSYFDLILSEVAILLVLSKDFLVNWSKSFSRIVETHPTPANSISNLVRLTMRGEALISDNYSSPHRVFHECAKLFVSLVDEDNDASQNMIWLKKRNRIIDVLGGKR